MNYFQRLDSYRKQNFFSVNAPFIDLYAPKVASWCEKLDVVTDILTHASEMNLKNDYEILMVRIVGGELDSQTAVKLVDTLATANQLLADKLGKSEVWEDLKGPDVPPRHFTTVSLSVAKPMIVSLDNFEDTNNDTSATKSTSNRKSRAVRDVPDDTEPI